VAHALVGSGVKYSDEALEACLQNSRTDEGAAVVSKLLVGM
jgi:hypothetical protein